MVQAPSCIAPDSHVREQFDPFMRSLFDDHMYDLAERALAPDRGYDDLPIRIEVPEDVLRHLG